MKAVINLLLLLSILINFSCSHEEEKYPISKPYWDYTDYGAAIWELNNAQDEKLPTYDDPETAPILKKILDRSNYEVVLNDNSLGKKYKNELASKYWDNLKNLSEPYSQLNRQDHYLYEKEFILTTKFFLGFQPVYFESYIELARETAEDMESVQPNIDSNVQILFDNYTNYLDYFNFETRFSEQGITSLGEGLSEYFIPLANNYPEFSKKIWLQKVIKLQSKVKSVAALNELSKLQQVIAPQE